MSALTGDGSATGAFEANPSAFGVYHVDSAMGEGRFGPVFRAHDPAGAAVLVRMFTYPFSPEQRDRFIAALDALCRAPLEHPSIARPIAYGTSANGQPYIVHTYLAGTPLAEFTAAIGRRGLDDIVHRVTYLAGALDFAAATGVLHGALSASDVIFSTESAGVSGLGLVQAFDSAGIEGFRAERRDDVRALMELARTVLGDRATPAASSVLTAAPMATALEFAAALHRTILEGSTPSPVESTPVGDPDPVSATEFPFEPVQQDLQLAQEEPEEWAGEFTTDHDHLVDVQLRRDEEKLPPPPMFGVTEPLAAVPLAPSPARPSSRGWLAMGIVALGLGVLAGFTGGFFVARETPAPAVSQPQAPKPEPTNGQTFTDAPVNDVPTVSSGAQPPASVVQPDSLSTEPRQVQQSSPEAREAAGREAGGVAAPQRPASTTAQRTQQPSSPPERSGPAAVRVDSLPAGAQVFVDGRSVGYTPLVVGELTPGTHSIRMQLPGYRPWVSAVTLAPGARERISASLEQ